MKQRLVALEKKSAEEGIVLTEAQVQALERKKDDDQAHGEIETHHPGYLGSQDTFYVGTIKGVGRIYQQTFVDTYSKWADAKLYATKTPITGQYCPAKQPDSIVVDFACKIDPQANSAACLLLFCL